MPSLRKLNVRVSAIGGTSFTLTPVLGIGTAGAQVDGGAPVGDPDISSGINTIVVNSTGAPDTTFVRHVNQAGHISISLEN